MTPWLTPSTLPAQLRRGALTAELRAQVESSVEATTKTGKPYRQLSLRDGGSSLLLRFWQDAASYSRVSELRGGEFLAVDGRWEDKGFGPEVVNARLRELDEAEIADLLAGDPAIAAVQAEAWRTVEETVAGLREPRLKSLAEAFLADHGPAFRRAAAAANFHHARRGGLVEHVAGMLRSASALCAAYPQLHRDLLLVGVLFHDCGKLWENPLPEHGFSQVPQFEGEMLGHIVIGIELVNALWKKLEAAEHSAWSVTEPSHHDLRLHLLHLIASHHGEHEWGSPVLPKTPEAIALHYIDNLDAKLEMLSVGYAQAEVAPRIHPSVRPLRQRLVAPLPLVTAAPVPEPPARMAPDPNSEPTGQRPVAVRPVEPNAVEPPPVSIPPGRGEAQSQARPTRERPVRDGAVPPQPAPPGPDPLDAIPWEKDDLF